MVIIVCTSSDDALYFCEVSWKYLEWFSHEITIVKFQREITPKIYRQELQFLSCAHQLIMLYISMKFHENILKGFQVIELPPTPLTPTNVCVCVCGAGGERAGIPGENSKNILALRNLRPLTNRGGILDTWTGNSSRP